MITFCAGNFKVSANPVFCKQTCRDLGDGCYSYCNDLMTCVQCFQIKAECMKKCRRKAKNGTTLKAGRLNIRKLKKMLKKSIRQGQQT